MAQQKSWGGSNHWLDVLWNILAHFGRSLEELAYGVVHNIVPWRECAQVALGASIVLSTRLDVWVAKKSGLLWLYPFDPLFYWILAFFSVYSGLFIWALKQAYRRVRLMNQLKAAFLNAGLKTASGNFPAFISNTPIDDSSYRLSLSHRGIPKKEFEKAKDTIEASLQIYIDHYSESRSNGTVDIYYSHSDISKIVPFDLSDAPAQYRFIVGHRRGGAVIESLSGVPHLLVAGESGGGKSTFLRQLICTFYFKNPDCELTLIDLKGGLEFQIFERLKRAHVVGNLKSAVHVLERMEQLLESRMTLLRANDCKDIDEYLVLPPNKRKTTSDLMGRRVIVVDEIAEIFLSGAGSSTKEIQRARAALSRIARQGRAVGIHLVAATQRPDSKALDPQVKMNLPGILCFSVPNDASSINVLGNGRATDLPPDIKGRAIWKRNGEMTEVQTPKLEKKTAETLLKDEYLPKDSKGDLDTSSGLDTSPSKKSVENKGTIHLGV